MPRLFHSIRAAGLLLVGIATPCASHAQDGSVAATATVIGRPLTLSTVTATASPALLRVRLDGCGSGAISVEARGADGQAARLSRVQVEASATCAARDILLPLLRGADAGVTQFEVSLSHSNVLVSPAFQQFVVTTAAAGAGAGHTLIY